MNEILDASEKGLHIVDWICIAIYAAIVLGVGWIYSRRQSDRGSYFIGNGKMNSFIIGISIYATLLSSASYLMIPGEIIKHGPVILCYLFAIPIAYLIVGYILIPALMRHRVISAYQILEKTLGMKIRILGASLFIMLRLTWMSVIVYFAAEATVVIVGLDPSMLPWVILVIGIISVTYTTMGGLQAVVMTDLLQFCVLFGGAILTLVVISFRLKGIHWIPLEWSPNWDIQPFFSFDPTVRVTVFGSITLFLIWLICMGGADQTVIQRYMSTKDVVTARRAYFRNSLTNIITMSLIALIGFAVLEFYTQYQYYIPKGESIQTYADKLFPLFISEHLPIGIAGLVVSALFAAGMSSIDSGINSITAVITTDFLDFLGLKSKNEKQHLRMARFIGVGIGVVVMVVSIQMNKVPGNFVEIPQKTINLFTVPMFCLFFFALFVPFATPFGVALGSIYGWLAGVLIAYWDVFTGHDRLSFQLIMLTALIVNISVGCVFSLIPLKQKSSRVIVIWTIIALSPIGFLCSQIF